MELETHLVLAERLGFLSSELSKSKLLATEEISRMLAGLIASIERNKS